MTDKFDQAFELYQKAEEVSREWHREREKLIENWHETRAKLRELSGPLHPIFGDLCQFLTDNWDCPSGKMGDYEVFRDKEYPLTPAALRELDGLAAIWILKRCLHNERMPFDSQRCPAFEDFATKNKFFILTTLS